MSLGVRLFASLALAVPLVGGCSPDFSPDWQRPNPEMDAAMLMPTPIGDAASDASTAVVERDAAIDSGLFVMPSDAGNGQRVFKCFRYECDAAMWANPANNCQPVPICTAACADVLCTPEEPCMQVGRCGVDCDLCEPPVIR